jgi:hypothetical protein
VQAQEHYWYKLNCSDKTKIETIVIGELKNEPILRHDLHPRADIRERIGGKENSEISMAERTPISVLIYSHSHYSTLMTSPGSSNIKTVVILIALGSIAWLAAGVVALAMGAESKVIWTCVVGAALGAIGIRYSIRRSRRTGI